MVCLWTDLPFTLASPGKSGVWSQSPGLGEVGVGRVILSMKNLLTSAPVCHLQEVDD